MQPKLGFENSFTYKRTSEVYAKMAEQYAFAGDNDEDIILSPNGKMKWRNMGKDSMYVLATNHESGGAGRCDRKAPLLCRSALERDLLLLAP